MVEELVAAAGPAAPPLVSVVVPVYNKRAFLRASLDSIVAASNRAGRVQLIFVDHHSSDGSYELLGEYANDADVQRFRRTGRADILGGSACGADRVDRTAFVRHRSAQHDLSGRHRRDLHARSGDRRDDARPITRARAKLPMFTRCGDRP